MTHEPSSLHRPAPRLRARTRYTGPKHTAGGSWHRCHDAGKIRGRDALVDSSTPSTTPEADNHADLDQAELIASMSAQLDDLYADRQRLAEATGLVTVTEVLALIESMQTQLESLYAERDESLKQP
jgi:hypothetical protein